jgi:hypothetical protein
VFHTGRHDNKGGASSDTAQAREPGGSGQADEINPKPPPNGRSERNSTSGRHNCSEGLLLIKGVEFDGLTADKAFDSNALITGLNDRGTVVVVSGLPARSLKPKIDREIYNGAT